MPEHWVAGAFRGHMRFHGRQIDAVSARSIINALPSCRAERMHLQREQDELATGCSKAKKIKTLKKNKYQHSLAMIFDRTFNIASAIANE